MTAAGPRRPLGRQAAWTLALVIPLLAAPMLPAIAADALDTTAGATADPATLDPTIVTGRRLDAARAAIEPRLGASTYTLPSQALENRPGADNTPFNQIMLQTPGVSQEAFGQIHVRNEMANMQYRLVRTTMEMFKPLAAAKSLDGIKTTPM
jgi:hypothetical protein